MTSHLAEFMRIAKWRFNKCLDPSFSCQNDAIAAHSVQRSKALSFIADKGHVLELNHRLIDGEPVLDFHRVGVRNASTFPGFCSKHDSELFELVDKQEISLENDEQLFLIAYRAVSRELHVVMEAAGRIQGLYQRQVSLGQVPGDQPSQAGVEAIGYLKKSHDLWRYRVKHFDRCFVDRRFDRIKHSTHIIEGPPTVGSSSFYYVKYEHKKLPIAGTLNVVPISDNQTLVVFSYPGDQSSKVRKFLSPIFTKSGTNRELEISRFIIHCTENFFLSPTVYAAWSEEKISRIKKDFSKINDWQRKFPIDEELSLF